MVYGIVMFFTAAGFGWLITRRARAGSTRSCRAEQRSQLGEERLGAAGEEVGLAFDRPGARLLGGGTDDGGGFDPTGVADLQEWPARAG